MTYIGVSTKRLANTPIVFTIIKTKRVTLKHTHIKGVKNNNKNKNVEG